jgi:hypothetical protein
MFAPDAGFRVDVSGLQRLLKELLRGERTSAARMVFLKVWLRATRRETQIPFGNDNKNTDSSSERVNPCP